MHHVCSVLALEVCAFQLAVIVERTALAWHHAGHWVCAASRLGCLADFTFVIFVATFFVATLYTFGAEAGRRYLDHLWVHDLQASAGALLETASLAVPRFKTFQDCSRCYRPLRCVARSSECVRWMKVEHGTS